MADKDNVGVIVACRKCSAILKASPDMSGRTVRCPRCKRKNRLPPFRPDANSAPVATESAPATAAQPPADDSLYRCWRCSRPLQAVQRGGETVMACPACDGAAEQLPEMMPLSEPQAIDQPRAGDAVAAAVPDWIPEPLASPAMAAAAYAQPAYVQPAAAPVAIAYSALPVAALVAHGPAGPAADYAAPSPDGPDVAARTTIAILRSTRPWILVMGVLLHISGGTQIVAGVGFSLALVKVANGTLSVLALLVAFAGLFLLLPASFLCNCASRIARLDVSHSRRELDAALEWQRKYWKFVAILALCGVALNFVGLPLAISDLGAAFKNLSQE